jgi:uncharacterized membrane protein YciS (DUF1049 family)
MKIRLIFTIIITAIVTIIFVQNNETMSIQILWSELKISKLLVLGLVFIVGLIVGLLWGAGMGSKGNQEPVSSSNLSDEDKEFLES